MLLSAQVIAAEEKAYKRLDAAQAYELDVRKDLAARSFGKDVLADWDTEEQERVTAMGERF